MKKILFIMILATTLIPISQTGASIGDMNVSYKANEIQTMENQETGNVLNNESLPIHEKIKQGTEKKNISLNKTGLTKKRISSERKNRLFGLLLLAHGGQR